MAQPGATAGYDGDDDDRSGGAAPPAGFLERWRRDHGVLAPSEQQVVESCGRRLGGSVGVARLAGAVGGQLRRLGLARAAISPPQQELDDRLDGSGRIGDRGDPAIREIFRASGRSPRLAFAGLVICPAREWDDRQDLPSGFGRASSWRQWLWRQRFFRESRFTNRNRRLLCRSGRLRRRGAGGAGGRWGRDGSVDLGGRPMLVETRLRARIRCRLRRFVGISRGARRRRLIARRRPSLAFQWRCPRHPVGPTPGHDLPWFRFVLPWRRRPLVPARTPLRRRAFLTRKTRPPGRRGARHQEAVYRCQPGRIGNAEWRNRGEGGVNPPAERRGFDRFEYEAHDRQPAGKAREKSLVLEKLAQSTGGVSGATQNDVDQRDAASWVQRDIVGSGRVCRAVDP